VSSLNVAICGDARRDKVWLGASAIPRNSRTRILQQNDTGKLCLPLFSGDFIRARYGIADRLGTGLNEREHFSTAAAWSHRVQWVNFALLYNLNLQQALHALVNFAMAHQHDRVNSVRFKNCAPED